MTEGNTMTKMAAMVVSTSLGSCGYMHPHSVHHLLYVRMSVCMYVLYIHMIDTHCVPAEQHVPSPSRARKRKMFMVMIAMIVIVIIIIVFIIIVIIIIVIITVVFMFIITIVCCAG